MKTLTKKQKTILQIIKEINSTTGKMPSIRNILSAGKKYNLNLRSTRSVYLYIKKLEEKGFLERKGKKNKIQIAKQKDDNFISVPIYGSTNAGLPTIFAEQYVEGFLKISRNIIGNKKVFAVEVNGDSMDLTQVNNKRIEDGDFVIVQTDNNDYKDGDSLLIIIDGLATVKKFKRLDKNHIGLFPQSTNSKHRPIYLTDEDSYIINGKVIDVFKTFKNKIHV